MFILGRSLVVFGDLRNTLVVLSILRQNKNELKNNYYFLVLYIVICDLAVLVINLFKAVEFYRLEGPLSVNSPMIACHSFVIAAAFKFAEVHMLLTISLLCFCATVHPLKPESCLWSGISCWFDGSMWNTFAVVLYKTEGRERVSFLFYLAFLVFFVSLFQ